MSYSAKRAERGDKAVREFLDHSKVELIRHSTLEEDKYERWDVLVNLNGHTIKTDVKSFNPKRAYGSDAYIELVNRSGYAGWVVPNNVPRRFVTWETSDSWLTCDIQDVFDLQRFGVYPKQEGGELSKLVRIPFADLEKIQFVKLDKEG